MFHLYLKSGKTEKYYRLREDILEMLDTRWQDLCPSKPSTKEKLSACIYLTFLGPGSMLNSLSKVLSTNSHLFASGLTVKGSHGWWGLHIYEAPVPATSAIPKEPKPPVPVIKRSFPVVQKPCSLEKELKVLSSDSSAESSHEDDYTDATSDDEKLTLDGKAAPSQDLIKHYVSTIDPKILSAFIRKQLQAKQPRAKVAKIEIVDDYPSPPLVPAASLSSSQKPNTLRVLPFLKAFQLPLVESQPHNRGMPYENDLLKRCVQLEKRYPVINRFARKLVMRQQKRKVQLPMFDLDHWMYLYLKSGEEPLVLQKPKTHLSPNPAFQSLPANFNPDDIPFISDPSRSMYVNLTGLASLYGQIPYPVTSPFTGKLLEPFVWRDTSFSCPKMKLLKEIRDFGGIAVEDDDNDDDDEEEEDYQESLDFVHLRREFVGQCNDLLSLSFWPGIDVSEALEYPDYTMLALYRHAVIACAFITPDGYLSYLHVRPDFQGHKIALKLLALLLPIVAPRKDITLHVSVTNAPAILLYQQFGFKPEEFIVNFYEKYYPQEFTQEHSKNAFLMRLKR